MRSDVEIRSSPTRGVAALSALVVLASAPRSATAVGAKGAIQGLSG